MPLILYDRGRAVLPFSNAVLARRKMIGWCPRQVWLKHASLFFSHPSRHTVCKEAAETKSTSDDLRYIVYCRTGESRTTFIFRFRRLSRSPEATNLTIWSWVNFEEKTKEPAGAHLGFFCLHDFVLWWPDVGASICRYLRSVHAAMYIAKFAYAVCVLFLVRN